MTEQFEYLLKASTGWSQARLTLSDGEALLEYDSKSIGQVPVRFELGFNHERISDSHGALTMTSLEQFRVQPGRFAGQVLTDQKDSIHIGPPNQPVKESDEAVEQWLPYLNRLVIEYIRLPEPQMRLEMPGGMWGIDDWTHTFSLLLLIHEAGFWADESDEFKETPLGRALERLDKMPMAAASGKYSLDT